MPFPSVAVRVPDKLQQVMLPLVDRDQCNDWYQFVYESGQGVSNPFGTNRPISDKMQCAGYEEGGRSTCFVSSPYTRLYIKIIKIDWQYILV